MFQLFLFGFIGSGQLCETLIGNLAFDVILIKPLDNAIKLGNTSLGCIKFLLALTKIAFGLLFGFLCHNPYELVLVFSRI
ncbi:MAG: hypothetical protein IJ515_01900, partial [Clostridia bacterium]|nr:hypothetical protein [Clostridia bacterium]